MLLISSGLIPHRRCNICSCNFAVLLANVHLTKPRSQARPSKAALLGGGVRTLLFACLALTCFSDHAYAQFTEAHNYDNTPVGVNQVELTYAYAHANTSIDTSLIVEGAKFNVNQGTISYTRYFGLAQHLMWVEASLPLANASGSVSNTNIQTSITGLGDSSFSVSTLLMGARARSADKFSEYKPTTTLGASLAITTPTGQYNPDRLLNLGADRWSFKPEISLSHPFGPEQKWQLDAYGNISIFTDNTSYHGTQVLRQELLPGIEGHVSYSFTDSVWASLDTRYSFRGPTLVDGVNQDNPQQNFTLGSEINISLNHRNSLVFEFAKAVAHKNGPALTGFAIKYSYSWGNGY